MSKDQIAKADIAVRAADLHRLRTRALQWADGWLDDRDAQFKAVYFLLDLLDAVTGDLLAVEWAGAQQAGFGDGTDPCCPACGAEAPRFGFNPEGKHDSGCRIDAHLSELGYATQAERDAERERRAKR